MSNQFVYHRESFEDTTHLMGGAWIALSQSMTDLRFHQALAELDPQAFARALLPEELREWLNDNMVPSEYSLHMSQQRHSDHSYSRRAWIEFRKPRDAVRYKLTWGGQTFNS
ncbi:hypothetical protein [Methylobacterium sp. NFXW15]|uniref:hypothetical protein n=1 Tax=Methylobacterium sp. NFXW15 TaxID=2819512 RepID=UPI003CEA4D1D